MNRTWFITGISSGLGKALAETIMNRGDFVIGTLRNQDQVDSFNAKYGKTGQAVLLDISDFHQMEEKIQTIMTQYSIDVLVNNAGIGFVGAIEESSIEEIRKVMEINFLGTLKLTQLVLPHMRANHSGTIVQVSSHGGVKAFAGFGIYNASKFALEGFSEALAQEVTPLGIKVTIVEPGPFRTQFAGNGLLMAERIIYDYSDTAGSFRQKLKGVHGKQEGDPYKAAEAIIDHVYKGVPTLRLPLGKIPMITMGMKIDSLKNDLEHNRKIAESVIHES